MMQIKSAILTFLLFAFAASTSSSAADASRVFVGSTPGGKTIRDFLRIPNDIACDKIQWRLQFFENSGSATYRLSVTYGLQEPGAPGFVTGGTTVEFQGPAELITATPAPAAPAEARRYHKITTTEPARSLSFLVINNDLIHIVDAEMRLLVGNEFWNYTLSREGVGLDR